MTEQLPADELLEKIMDLMFRVGVATGKSLSLGEDVQRTREQMEAQCDKKLKTA